MARRKASGTLTFTKADSADMSMLLDLYISTGRIKVTKCPEFRRERRLSINRKHGGGCMPAHLNPLTMGDHHVEA